MSQGIRDRIATKIKKLKVLKKLNREELSLLLGFDNSYISKLEKGNINITIDKLDMIAKYFDLDVKDLL